MNKCAPKTPSGNHSVSEFKKPRKKKYRNRRRNLKRKKLKNFYKSNSCKSEISDSMQTNIMSNWYWSNYKKAMEWQDKHKVAHWRACALALFEENRCLMQIINNMKPGMVPKLPYTQKNFTADCVQTKIGTFNNQSYSANQNNDIIESDDNEGSNDEDDDGFEFEMSEEMINFFEKSYKHKMEMKKLKEKELLDNVEEEVKQIQQSKIKRTSEMSILYGEGASMIVGMETAVQLSFDKYCDSKSPKFWPNIPFRL